VIKKAHAIFFIEFSLLVNVMYVNCNFIIFVIGLTIILKQDPSLVKKKNIDLSNG